MSDPDAHEPPRRVAPPTVTGLASLTVEPPPAPLAPPPPPPRRDSGRQALLIVGAVVVVAVLLGVGLLLRSARETAPDSGAVVVSATSTASEEATVVEEETAVVPEAETPTPDAVEDEVEEPAGKQFTTDTYTLTLPDGWVRDKNEVDHDAFIESRWHLKGSPEVYALVDYTPGTDITPAQGARGVRKYYVDLDGYEELVFERVDLAGRSAFQWQFAYKGNTKVDYFLSECNTGYAFLGAAPSGRFDEHEATFTAIAESLEPTC